MGNGSKIAKMSMNGDTTGKHREHSNNWISPIKDNTKKSLELLSKTYGDPKHDID